MTDWGIEEYTGVYREIHGHIGANWWFAGNKRIYSLYNVFPCSLLHLSKFRRLMSLEFRLELPKLRGLRLRLKRV